MRCFGLTAERRRCEQEAAGETAFCALHAPSKGLPLPAAPDPSLRKNGHRPGLLARFKSLAPPAGTPDTAHYSVPGWLWNSPAGQVIHHLHHDPDPIVRWLAAFTLRRRREAAAIEPLWDALAHEPVRLVRQQSAVAVGKIGTPYALSPLIEALWHDPDPGVRQACAIALGNLGDPSSASDLLNVLEREENELVRWDLILALGQLRAPQAEPLLQRLATTERALAVRDACRDALAAIRGA